MTCVSRDHLSVSHDYGTRNLDEYFHFYSIAGQKFKMKEIFKKFKSLHVIIVFHALQLGKKLFLFDGYKVNARFWVVSEFHISRCSFLFG